MSQHGSIRVGIGGWTFEPWRGNFYPPGLPHKRELEYASRRLTSIEVNGTFYGAQKPESFARWREEAPDGFVFSLKGPRFTTHRRVLAEAGASIERFLTGGVLQLKEKLGPINWQFQATKQYDPADFEAFLKLLPHRLDGQDLRHVVEVRHASFVQPDFVALLRVYGVGAVVADHDTRPLLAEQTAPFVYARLQRASPDEASGYSATALAHWAERALAWATGTPPRDVFLYMINGFKPKAPSAAMALIERLAAFPEAAKPNGGTG